MSTIYDPSRGAAVQPLGFGNIGDTAVPVAPATPLPVYSPGGLMTASASFVRPSDTTAYAIGDLIANSTTAGLVVPIEIVNAARDVGEAVRFERWRLRKSSNVLTGASFRIHIFRTAPVVSVGDNGAFNTGAAPLSILALADIAGRVGSFDVTMDVAATVGAMGIGTPSAGSGATCEAAGTLGHEKSVWALIEARAAYTPVSGETFTAIPEGARS